jgi:hypothetical protein
MKMPSYYRDIAEFPENKQKEIINGFNEKHKDFRDSVQRPMVLSTFFIILGSGFINAVEIDGKLMRFIAFIILGLFGLVINRVAHKLCEKENLDKFKAFLKQDQ